MLGHRSLDNSAFRGCGSAWERGLESFMSKLANTSDPSPPPVKLLVGAFSTTPLLCHCSATALSQRHGMRCHSVRRYDTLNWAFRAAQEHGDKFGQGRCCRRPTNASPCPGCSTKRTQRSAQPRQRGKGRLVLWREWTGVWVAGPRGIVD
jgi:hypothetical protein